jgi:DNA-binding SARP family transcriptional activator
VEELADQGSRGAFELAAIGRASVAHIAADSAAVLAALDGIGSAVTPEWLPTIHWFRSVAHRRNGDLLRAFDELDDADDLVGTDPDMSQQLRLARARTDWLAGQPEEVRAELAAIHEYFAAKANRFLAVEAAIELAAKAAFLGEVGTARTLLAGAEPMMSDMPGQLARILHGIAAAAVAVGVGDEVRAADAIRTLVLETLERTDRWYWTDRSAIALSFVLVPESRQRWACEPLAPVHSLGLTLGEALVAARCGDLAPVRRLDWPTAGLVRTHLPMRWVVELAAAARAADAPAPSEITAALGVGLHPTLKALGSVTDGAVGAAARAWLRQTPPVPNYRLRVEVLGPLRILRDDVVDNHPDLARPRVRQLLSYLIIHRHARREKVAEDLWPDAADAGQSLRVTLTYLQRALQPERARGDAPYFVTTEGAWLTLTGRERLEVDAWQLDQMLDHAVEAERAGEPGEALTAYRNALNLWGGEPLADVPYDDWAGPLRTRLEARYCAGAVRAGELLLATGAVTDAIAAGEQAIAADPTTETAYAVVIRGYLRIGDTDGAQRTLDRCADALATAGRTVTAVTATLLPTPAAHQP